MNKFTPGPWHLSAGTYSQRWVVDSKSPPTGKQNLIAMLQSHWKGNENDTMDANANLIAAAPTLYEALNEAHSALIVANGCKLTIKKIEAALEAAERGEG